MENQEEKKMNKKALRLLIGVSLVCISLAIGVVSGIKIGKAVSIIPDNTPSKEESNDNQNSLSNNEIIEFLKNNWMSEIYYNTSEIDEDLLIRQFVGALSTYESTNLDPYTYFIKNAPAISVPALGKLGITLTNYYNIPIITEVNDGGAADGYLQKGDIVVRLGKKAGLGGYAYSNIYDKGVTFSNFFTNCLGYPGQKQYVKVARFDSNNALTYKEFEITLGEATPVNYSYLVDENIDDTIMIKMTSFKNDNENKNGTADQLENILKDDNSKNLIIDLRDNGGGDLSSAIDVCDLFLPKDTLVTTVEFKDGRKTEYKTFDNTVYDYENIVILQNENTASASEIVISTLKHYFGDKVTLVGTKSYGKGIAQTKVKVLEGEYTLQYTCAKWYQPDGSWLGMTIDSNSDVGFKPAVVNTISSNYLLDLMESYSYLMRVYDYYLYKSTSEFLAFKLDKVAIENEIFFDLLNNMTGSNYRKDMYFDANCQEGLKLYQEAKGLDKTGAMNLDTLVCFTNEYYNQKLAYSDSFVNKAKTIIEG